MKCPNNVRKLFGFEFNDLHEREPFFVERAVFSDEYHIKYQCKHCGAFMDRDMYVSQAAMVSRGYNIEKLKKLKDLGVEPKDLR